MNKTPDIKVVAVVDGGKIVHVYCDSRNLDFSVINMDTEDLDDWKEAVNTHYDIAQDNEYFKIF